ncbi:MAG: leucyl aminopeptidase [Bacillota bacterium]|nr:leucyl aminopeptidase [Bacillota bacterium]
MADRVQVSIADGSMEKAAVDGIIVNLFEGVRVPGGATGAVDEALGGLLSEAIRLGELKGSLYQTRIYPSFGRIPAKRVVVVGLGPSKEFNLLRAERAAAAAVRAGSKAGLKSLATIVHGAGIGALDPEQAFAATVRGIYKGLYRFDAYRSSPEGSRVERVEVVERNEEKRVLYEKVFPVTKTMAEAVAKVRDWVNTPPRDLTPDTLEEEARRLAEIYGFTLEIIKGEALLEKGMEALYGVGKGSQYAPRLLRLSYRGGEGKAPLALVGKGVTFDSGGLSLKTAQGMETMKADMAGGAAVLGAAQAVGELKPKVSVDFLVATVENLPGSRAQKPGDVVRVQGGKTVEVLNTDAEGRLILADAVAYARQEGASHIVDVATLTGAAIVALGQEASFLLGNDEELLAALEKAHEAQGERIWRMPSWPEYREYFKSSVADIRNTSSGGAGAITGGLIIGTFAEDRPWAHIDLGATVFRDEEAPYSAPGATGGTTASLVQLVLDWAERK